MFPKTKRGEQHLVVGNTAECEHGGFADENVRLFILKTNKQTKISQDIPGYFETKRVKHGGLVDESVRLFILP